MNKLKKLIATFSSLAIVGALLTAIPLPAQSNQSSDPVSAYKVAVPPCTEPITRVCYDASNSSLSRGQQSIPFELFYTDGIDVISLVVEQGELKPITNLGPRYDANLGREPLAGDVGNFTIKFPGTSEPISLDTSRVISRGHLLAAGAYVTTKAKTFDYIKTVSGNVVTFEIDIEFVEVWERPGCTIDSDIEDTVTGLSAPTPQCEEANIEGSPANSYSYVWQEIAIWTGVGLWFGPEMDGMILNTRAPSGSIGQAPAGTAAVNRITTNPDTGQVELAILHAEKGRFGPTLGENVFLMLDNSVPGLPSGQYEVAYAIYPPSSFSPEFFVGLDFEASIDVGRVGTAIAPGSIEFQEVGPKFANGTSLNTGALEIFLPQPLMSFIFGNLTNVQVSNLLAQRVDVLSSNTISVQNLTPEDNSLTVSPQRGGLRITAEHGFSAPGFIFASTAKSPLVSTPAPDLNSEGGGSDSGTSGTVIQPPANSSVAASPAVAFSLERKPGARVKVDRLRALADFNLRPGQKVRIRIAKLSRLSCRLDSGRIVSLTGEACLIRATKILADGSKSEQRKLIRITYR